MSGPAKALFNGPLKTLKRPTQMCVRADGQRRLRWGCTDLKWGKVVKECLRTKCLKKKVRSEKVRRDGRDGWRREEAGKERTKKTSNCEQVNRQRAVIKRQMMRENEI